jgi:thiol:disulfide interchange protein DsbD
MVPIQSPAAIKDGQPQKITALVRYLICSDVCIPGQKQLELSLPVRSAAAPSEARKLFDAARSRLPWPAPRNWKISATSTEDEFRLKLRIGKLTNAPEFFPLNAEQIENAASQEATAVPGGILLHLKKSKHLLKPVARLKGVVVLGSERAYLVDVLVTQTSGRSKRN